MTPDRVVPGMIMFAATWIGRSSLLLFCALLFVGPVAPIPLTDSAAAALAVDAALSFVFFVQHSAMVRASFRRRSAALVPDHYHQAAYAIASGVVLIAVVVFWQPAGPDLVVAAGPWRWILRSLFVAALSGFVWGVRSLGSFDAFGIRPIRAQLAGRTLQDQPLAIRGAYRWVRHPLYTCVLILLWSFPHLTADRLLLNLSWTIWIVVGTFLEERDMVAVFGDDYRAYQRRVPMLIPFRRPS